MQKVRLFKRTSGTLNEYTVLPGGEWHGCLIVPYPFNGEIAVVKGQAELALGKGRKYHGWRFLLKPRAIVELALGNKGKWLGGFSYHGWVFMKPGAVVEFKHKSKKDFLVCSQEGIRWEDFPPDAASEEL